MLHLVVPCEEFGVLCGGMTQAQHRGGGAIKWVRGQRFKRSQSRWRSGRCGDPALRGGPTSRLGSFGDGRGSMLSPGTLPWLLLPMHGNSATAGAKGMLKRSGSHVGSITWKPRSEALRVPRRVDCLETSVSRAAC